MNRLSFVGLDGHAFVAHSTKIKATFTGSLYMLYKNIMNFIKRTRLKVYVIYIVVRALFKRAFGFSRLSFWHFISYWYMPIEALLQSRFYLFEPRIDAFLGLIFFVHIV